LPKAVGNGQKQALVIAVQFYSFGHFCKKLRFQRRFQKLGRANHFQETLGKMQALLLQSCRPGLRKVPSALSIAPTLLLLGGNVFSPTAQFLDKGGSKAEAPTASLQVLSALPAATARTWVAQTLPNPGSSGDRTAIRQAVLTDPLINEYLRQAAARSPGVPVHPLETGAIAIAENYALVEVSAGVGDLPVIDGCYLLKKHSGQWVVVAQAGWEPGLSINPSWLSTVLDVPKDVVSRLIDTLRSAGKEVEIDDTLYTDVPLPCITQIEDPNPPTNVRSTPAVAAGNVIGQLPNGTEVRVMEVLNGWLKIRQPLVGWVSMGLTRVSCGNSLAEVEKNLEALHSLEGELAREAADTLVRYLYRGAEGSLAEAALAHFNKLAINRFYALKMVLDRHTEEVRRQVLQQAIAAGIHPQARTHFEQEIAQSKTLSPTLKTWKTLN
jgi:hypothetical protein